jgi:hypothetical protein
MQMSLIQILQTKDDGSLPSDPLYQAIGREGLRERAVEMVPASPLPNMSISPQIEKAIFFWLFSKFSLFAEI